MPFYGCAMLLAALRGVRCLGESDVWMKIYGIAIVRNEADILGITVRYHLALGFDGFLIIDNGSSDDTHFVLKQLAKDKRVRWTRNESTFAQAQLTTELAHEVFRDGADWVAPVDADEFWFAPKHDFRAVLAQTTAAALRVDLVNFVQRREQLTYAPDALRYMTMRVAQTVGPLGRCRGLVESQQIGYIEMMYPPKYISRASDALRISIGNHEVSGLHGPTEASQALRILHAPLRCRAILEYKAEHWRRTAELVKEGENWHLERIARLQQENALDDEWNANSYREGALDVYGTRHPLIFDPALRDAVSAWTDKAWWRRVFRR